MDGDCVSSVSRFGSQKSSFKSGDSDKISGIKKVYLSPSEYLKQVSTNPEKLIYNIKKCDRIDCPAFSPIPKLVVFQKFTPDNSYTATLQIKNVSQLPHNVKLISTGNVYFNVEFRGTTLNSRLAPGMTLTYEVEFRPDEKRDYFHNIKFKSDVGSFSVPVAAIGPRPLLTFPDHIDMEESAIKVMKTKPILLQNIGEIATGYSMYTNNTCFEVTPSKGSIQVGEAIQIKVNFTPAKLNITSGFIFIRYESGDTVQTGVYGEGVKCAVRVLNDVINIDCTYLGLTRIASIVVQNSSNYLLHYELVKHKSIEDDIEEVRRHKREMQPLGELPYDHRLLPYIKELIRKRLVSDEIKTLMSKSYEYNDENFHIFPMSGEIWPRTTKEITVTFEPRSVGNISSIVYLEAGGLENRIPISLFSKCMGPSLELNLLSLDVQKVYLCSPYNYEIVCKNSGPVPGSLMHMTRRADFGSEITVEPNEITLDVDEVKSMNLRFISERTGDFIERVDFIIKESHEVLSLVMKGTVVCPIVAAEQDITFKPAALGFTMKRHLKLQNLSHAPIEYHIRIPNDGTEDVITHEEFSRAQTKPKMPCNPREYSIRPYEGILQPKSSTCVQILYTPNVARTGEHQLQMDLCKSSSAEPFLLPFNFHARTANFNVRPTELNIPFCFVNFPYCRSFIVTNQSEIDAYFYIHPQEITSNTSVIYSLSTYQGYLKPGQSKEIDVTIIVKTIGSYKCCLSIFNIGQDTPSACCEIICKGEGPVVSVEPRQLEFGEVQLLQSKMLTLKLHNDSPISAEFTTDFQKNRTLWEIDPCSGELEPNETAILEITVFLRDTGRYLDRLLISIFNGKTINVPLLAIGYGTSLVFEPEIFPTFDMGYLFRLQDISIPVRVKNEGTRHHNVLLTNVEITRPGKKPQAEETTSIKIFKIEPDIIDLSGGEEKTVYCTTRWNVAKIVNEVWYVYAAIEGIGLGNKREQIGSSMFTATFVDPRIIFDKSVVTFILDYDGCNCDELQQENELTITNQSHIDLTATMTIEPPFFMIDESCDSKVNECDPNVNELIIKLKYTKPVTIKIIFPFDVNESEPVPRTFSSYLQIKYKEHTKHTDKILCKSEVNFPNLAFVPDDVSLYCVYGYSTEEKVKLINSTPLTVDFNIKWIKESFVCHCFRGKSQGSEAGTASCKIDTPTSIDTLYSENQNLKKEESRLCQCTDDYHESCILDLCECPEAATCLSSEESTVAIFSIDMIEKFLQITPLEGQIGPYSEQYVTINFNGLDRAKITAKAVCEITRGQDQILNVTAISDNVKCDVEDTVLDYGLQLFSEPSVTTLKVINQCMIPLDWCIELSSDLLKIVETPQIFESSSESLIYVERRPSAPGYFSEKIFLEVTHLHPFIIEVRWLATIPQIYLDIPRIDAFEKYPVELQYRAIALLIAENTVEHTDNFLKLTCLSEEELNVKKDIKMTQYELMQLFEDNWEIISKEEKFPSQIDTDMAFERILAVDYIKDKKEMLEAVTSFTDLVDLHAPSYFIDMKYVIIDQSAELTLDLHNYGYEKARLKLRRVEVKRKSPKTAFLIQLERNAEICQCESSFLNIIFSPKKDVFHERKTVVNYTFYLEIKQGLTIPVKLRATACYPYVTVNQHILNFEKVFVGQCREMRFLLKNEAPIESQWQILIENPSKNPSKVEDSFFVHSTNGTLTPGQETAIKVFFKPFKNGCQKRQLIFIVQDGRETEKIRLIGCGIDRKLNINNAIIQFPPVIPKTSPAEGYFIIENNNSYPIEVYWQHLNDFSEFNRIVRILYHYYGQPDLLIPERNINDTMPQLLIDFYKSLIDEMCSDEDFRKVIELIFPNVQSEPDSSRLPSRSTIHSMCPSVRSTKSVIPTAIISHLEPNDIETLVHMYINKLQEAENFMENMKDPISELFKLDDKSITTSSTDEMQKLIIIFHGAPFTEYQEAACKTATAMKFPVLNINQIILEAMASAETDQARKLADILHSRYNDLTAKLVKQASKLEESVNIFDIMKKIPPPEEFDIMDSFSIYELKFEIVMELTQLFATVLVKTKKSVKGQDLSDKKQNCFPEVSQDLYAEILRERLSQPKFKHGFVLQTLNNEFIAMNPIMLRTLLDVVGNEEVYYFITFYNSAELYEQMLQALNETSNTNSSSNDISESPGTQVDLSMKERKGLCTKIILNKGLRKTCTDSAAVCKSKSEESIAVTSAKVDKSTGSKRTSSRMSRDVSSLIDFSAKRLSAIKENEEITTEDLEFEKILTELNEYEIGLNKLIETIIEWETNKPTKSKGNKIKRKTSTLSVLNTVRLTPTEKFNIWYVQAADPRDEKMYDAVALTLGSNFDIPMSTSSKESLRCSSSSAPLVYDLSPRTMSILIEYETLPKSSLLCEIFTLHSYKPEKQPTPIKNLEPTEDNTTETPRLLVCDKVEDAQRRWTLQPRESQKFKVNFLPTNEGCFQTEFLLSLVDNAIATHVISVDGVGAVPKLDMIPASVFDRVKHERVSEVHEPTYFLDKETYHFGNLLVNRQKQNWSHTKSTKFCLRNISVVPALVNLSLVGGNYEFYEIEPQELEVKADESKFVNITACALRLCPITDILMLSIKYNDQPELIKLECNGIDLKIDLEPKSINLERVLLHRIEKRVVTIQNSSPITLYWRAVIDETTTHVHVIPSAGKIKYNEICELELQYYAYMINNADKGTVNFEMFLNKEDEVPVNTNSITVSALIYEINLEFKVDNPIDFKSIPIGSTVGQSFTMKNLGAYEVQYEVKLQEAEVLKGYLDIGTIATLQHNFNIHPISGPLPLKKQAKINMSYTPSIALNLKSVPLYKVVIIEPFNDIGPAKDYLLNISATSYYNNFLIEPYPTLNFGTIALKSIKVMQLKIENCGNFPFEYSIMSKATLEVTEISLEKSAVASKADSKKQRKSNQSKAGNRKSSKSELQGNMAKWGPFSVEKVRGELEAKQSDIITVKCTSNSIGNFEEHLIVLVPNSLPCLEENKEMAFTVNVCIAEIDFKNFEEIFTESLILNTDEELKNLNELKEHTAFIKKSKCLYFRNVCIGNVHAVNVTLRNVSAVNGDLMIELFDNQSPESFAVSTNKLSILPLSKENFTITFAPNIIGMFHCKLRMNLDLPQNVDVCTSNFIIDLEGESCIPQIRVTGLDNDNYINFGLSFICTMRVKAFKIENIGNVVTDLTLELFEDAEDQFSIFLDESKNKLQCGCRNKYTEPKNITTSIVPGEIININVHYTPTKTEKSNGGLRMLVDKNPFENMEITFSGEGFSQPVILENLEIADNSASNTAKKTGSRESIRRNRKSSKNSNLLPNQTSSRMLMAPFLTYKLDYEKCYLSRMSKINFKITNKTEDKCFRFEWTSHPNILCIPLAGHLAPDSSKEITATFFSSECLTLLLIPIDCMINEIKFANPVTLPSWDTRQTQVSWMEKYPSSNEFEDFGDEDMIIKKVIVETQEPPFEVVPDTTTQFIQLLVSAVADYADFLCDVDFIEFEDTLMFQSNEKKFYLQNISKVNLDFSWSITIDDKYPIRMEYIENDDSKKDLKSLPNERCSCQKIRENCKNEEHKKQLQFKGCDSCEKSDLFSSSAALSDRSTDSWIEGENLPFTITPEAGTLGPEEKVECTLKFLPTDVFDYTAHLISKIENLNPVKTPLNITIKAKSLLPYCHFETEDSDYLISGRRDSNLPWPSGYSLADEEMRSEIRVVEFTLLGIGECHTRLICLVNPTIEDYSYRWSKLMNETCEEMPVFTCMSENGMAEKGKRTMIPFNMVPENVGLFESFWQFEIQKYNLKTVFLLVAHVTESSVSFSKTYLKLGLSTIGELQTGCFEVTNNENCPLSFQIKANSLYSEGRFQVLKISPMSGILDPKTPHCFKIEYKASLVGEFTFNVQIQIEKLKKPTQIIVLAKVIEIMPKVKYFNLEGEEKELKEKIDNIIDIGQLMLCEPVKIDFEISNIGQIAFDFSWNFSPSGCAFKVWSTQPEGTIDPGTNVNCKLGILASQKVIIQNHPISIKIKNAQIYRIKLNASAKKPPIEFSFNHYDFGPCYIQTQTGFFYSVELIVINHQKIPSAVKCDFEESLNMKVDLHQLSQPIPADTAVRILIHFQPTEERFYRGYLVFSTAESNLKRHVVVMGEGVSYKIHLKNPCDSIVDFGTLLVGRCSSRKIKITNEGRLPVKLKVVIIENTFEGASNCQPSKCFFARGTRERKTCWQPCNSSTSLESIEQQISANSIENLDINEFIKFSASQIQELKVNADLEIGIKFKAVQRVKLLKVRLGLQVDSSCFPLTVVKGICTSACLHLNRLCLSFGSVFQGCTSDENFILVNDGDIGSKFTWCADRLSPNFQIKPTNGFSAPGSEIMFTCTFKPTCEANFIQEKATLALEDHKDLTIDLSGNCLSFPETIDAVEFTASIRQSETKKIKVRNDSDKTWNLKPIILGDYFNIPSVLTIDPKTTSECEITYKPQKELVLETLHTAKLIINLPDGRQPVLYELRGRCTQDVPVVKIVRKTTAKKRHVETLPMYNNSHTNRTFDCKVEPINNMTIAPSNFLVDVPAKSHAYHEFPFYFEYEGQFLYKITFDDQWGNYQRYEIEFTVAGPEIQDKIELTTYVRTSIFHTLKIINSLETEAVTFDASSSNQDIRVHGLPTLLPPLTFKNVKLEYLPLLPCDVKETLTISSEILGSLFYELHLVAKPALPVNPIYVKASLGKSISFSVQLKNFTNRSCEFDLEVDKSSFSLLKTITVAQKEEAKVDVRFEPNSLETVEATIKAKSASGGEFIFPVVAETALPQPQGPFVVTPTSEASITFTNPFPKPKVFEFALDNTTEFKTHAARANVGSKKNYNIIVRLLNKKLQGSVVGKLTVTCTDQTLAEAKWIYYLRGRVDK